MSAHPSVQGSARSSAPTMTPTIRSRKTSPLALIVVLAAWAGLMALVLAPEGTFSPGPSEVSTAQR